MADAIPSTSQGTECHQANVDESLKTSQTGCASGVCGNCEGTDSTNNAAPESGFNDIRNYVNKWFISIENEFVLLTTCEINTTVVLKDAVVQWLGERWRSSDLNSKTTTPCLTTGDDRPRTPLYWWQKEQYKSTASALSSDATSSGPSDECAAAELMENGKKCPHLDIPFVIPTRKYQNKKYTASSSDSGRSLSESPWTPEILTQTPDSKESSATFSDESPLLELAEYIFLKCKPRPRATAPRVSEGSSPEEEVPHCNLSYDTYDEFLKISTKPRRSRSAGRQSRSLERERITHSAERNRPCSSFPIQSTTSGHDERPRRRFRSKLRRLFDSEDNLLQKVAGRGHEFYCSCLCIWYRIVKEYKKISNGLQVMNRQNR